MFPLVPAVLVVLWVLVGCALAVFAVAPIIGRWH